MDNLSLFLFIFGLNNHYQTLDNLMIYGAEIIIYFAIVFSFILALKGGINEKKSLLLSLISVPILFLIIHVIHLFILLPRPFTDGSIIPLISFQVYGPSFPSVHTSLISAIAYSYAFYRSKWAPVFLILMLWVGFSRIYVGVHYPFDIIGGFLAAGLSLFISVGLIKFFKKELF